MDGFDVVMGIMVTILIITLVVLFIALAHNHWQVCNPGQHAVLIGKILVCEN
jgi:hypothetical protein